MPENAHHPVDPDAPTGHGEITVTVHAPRDPDPKSFRFRRTELVGDAARTAAAAFGYETGNFSFEKDGEVLDRTKSLAAEHVHDHASLELVDVGGGV